MFSLKQISFILRQLAIEGHPSHHFYMHADGYGSIKDGDGTILMYYDNYATLQDKLVQLIKDNKLPWPTKDISEDSENETRDVYNNLLSALTHYKSVFNLHYPVLCIWPDGSGRVIDGNKYPLPGEGIFHFVKKDSLINITEKINKSIEDKTTYQLKTLQEKLSNNNIVFNKEISDLLDKLIAKL